MNEPEVLQPTEIMTAAASKADLITAQNDAIAAASVGSSVFRSAATYLADNKEIKGFQK